MFFSKEPEQESEKAWREKIIEKYNDTFAALDDSTRTSEQEEGMIVLAEEMISGIETSEPDVEQLEKLEEQFKKFDVEYFNKLMNDMVNILKGKIDEELPDASARFKGRLEALVYSVLMKHGAEIEIEEGETASVTAFESISELYYRLIKNHPFANGNKKVATAFLLEVIEKTGNELDPSELANLTLYIAQSNPSDHLEVVKKISNYIKSKM